MTRSSRTRTRRPVSTSGRPALETLEDRLAPALFTVNSVADLGNGFGLTGDLRYCISQVNEIGGANTIAFDSTVFSQPQTITLNSPLPTVTDVNLAIQGPGASLATVSGNQAFQILNVAAPVTLTGLTLANGLAQDGGALFNTSNLTLSNAVLSGNHATQFGGAIDNSGSLTLVNTSLSGSSSQFYGGGIENSGSVTAINSTLSGNSAGFQGGGIYNSGTLSLTASTLSGNSASQGGAIENKGTTTAINSTLANNYGHFGGGVLNFSSLTLTDCTVSGNLAAVRGGGLYNYGSSPLTLNNTLVAGNSGDAPDVFGAVNSASSFNLIGSNTGLSGLSNGLNGNQVGTAFSPIYPNLTAFGNWGGPIQTFALLPGSPAIDHGSNGLAQGATDQRGFGRIFNGKVDVGAVEFQGPGPETFTVNSTADNTQADDVLTLREALAYVQGNLGRPLTTSEQAQLRGEPANGSPAVNFDPGLIAGGPATITLNGPLPNLTVSNVTVQGPGASLLTLNGFERGNILTTSGVNETINGLSLINGGGSYGGAIQNNGSLTLTACTVSGNIATYGGGLFNAGTATVSGCAFSNNYAGDSGGAIDNRGTLTVTNSTLSGNTSRSEGGAIRNDTSDVLTLGGSTLSGNSSYNGAGLLNDNKGQVTVTNSTFVNNNANYGGGITNRGFLILADSTFSGNNANYGGGIHNGVNPVLLNNTLLAGNSGIAPDLSGAVTSNSSFNLIGDGTGLTGISNGVNGNQVGSSSNPINPLLSPLGNWGGPTQTIALLPGSPALAKGSASVSGLPSTDQRGDARLRNGTVDIGAFESQGFTVSVNSSAKHATVATVFAFPLNVTVSNAFGEPVTGGAVTFVAPSSGPSAILSAQVVPLVGIGQASVTATANTVAGSYVVSASVDPASVAGQLPLTNDPGAATQLLVSAASSVTAGKSFSVTVTAQDSYGNTATGYLGTVRFTSSDSQAKLPPQYTFTAGDGGRHVFTATFKTSGTQSISATDKAMASITGSRTLKVNPGLASHFVFSAPTSVPSGMTFSLTVTAEDAFGNVATGFKSKVHFTSTDPRAVLPADYLFVAKDKGVHTFSGVVLETVGSQTITVARVNKTGVKGTSGLITVTNPTLGPSGIEVGKGTGQISETGPSFPPDTNGREWAGLRPIERQKPKTDGILDTVFASSNAENFPWLWTGNSLLHIAR